jgi:hypothetical protein
MVDKNGKIIKVGTWVKFYPKLDDRVEFAQIEEIRIGSFYRDAAYMSVKGLYVQRCGRNSCEIEKATRDEIMIWKLEN